MGTCVTLRNSNPYHPLLCKPNNKWGFYRLEEKNNYLYIFRTKTSHQIMEKKKKKPEDVFFSRKKSVEQRMSFVYEYAWYSDASKRRKNSLKAPFMSYLLYPFPHCFLETTCIHLNTNIVFYFIHCPSLTYEQKRLVCQLIKMSLNGTRSTLSHFQFLLTRIEFGAQIRSS